MEIKTYTVRENKANGQKSVHLSAKDNFKKGDKVEVKKVEGN